MLRVYSLAHQFFFVTEASYILYNPNYPNSLSFEITALIIKPIVKFLIDNMYYFSILDF